MKVEKVFRVNAAREDVWAFITSPEKVAPCIPGCKGVEVTGPSTYKATLVIEVGPIRTEFNVDVEATEERPPEYSAYITRGEEGGRASRVKAESSLALRSVSAHETEVLYKSDINIVGRLGKFGLGIMKKKADALGDDFVAALRARIEGGTPDAAGAGPSTKPARLPVRSLLAACAALVFILLLVLYFLSSR
ncbi:MAG: hypothetical protein HYR49_09840 [Gammaproteobacteria bacterium]|nr:hypothetical protein [Gammaproteobacteria bacterium]